MNNRQQGRMPVYDNSFKIALAREYLTGNLGYKALAKKYGLQQHHTVRHFVKWYKKQYPQGGPLHEQPEQDKASDCVPDDGSQPLTKQLKEAH